MNLEEEVEKECFFTKFSRWSRHLVLPLITTSITTAALTASCSKKDKETIFGPEIPGTSKQEIIVTKTRTDAQGKAYFIENQAQEPIDVQVVDTNNNPLQKSNLDITFEDGINVEALFLQDPTGEYLPSRELFNSSSSVKKISGNQIRTLKTGKSKEFGGIYHIETIKDKNAGQLLVDWRQEKGYGWTLHYYLFTVNKEDAVKYYETQGKISDFFYDKFIYVFNVGKDKEIKPSDIIDKILEYGEISGDINAERWDVYKYSGHNIADNICFVPSNVPTLTLNEPRVEGSNVTLTWKGNDEATYKQLPTYFPIRDDPTILLGQTKDSDLKYFYNISKNNSILFQDSTVDNYKIYKNLQDGDYTLEILVQDEVGNKSEIKNKKFSIKGLVQEKTFNIFDYLILTKDSYWNYTNNYKEAVVDVGYYNGKKIAAVEAVNTGQYYQFTDTGLYRFGSNIGLTNEGDMFFKSVIQVGSSNIKIGDSFSTDFNIYVDLDYTIKLGNGNSKYDYLRLEDITVPVGVFKDCLVVREYLNVNLNNQASAGSGYMWLAKNVGKVKFKDRYNNVYELKSYSVK